MTEWARQLASADAATRAALLHAIGEAAAGPLAAALKAHFDDYKHTDITRARPAGEALADLAAHFPAHGEVQAYAAWTQASLYLCEGVALAALPLLDVARERFLALDQPLLAAATQLALVNALGVMGHYQEASATAFAARAFFAARGDTHEVAKIDLNLGNIFFFQGDYNAALDKYVQAEAAFSALGDTALQVAARDGIAAVLEEQGYFDDAATLHEQTLRLAEQHDDPLQVALSHNNLGYLYAHQGIYHRSLACFQQATAAFGALGMDHEQRTTELELCEVYLFLNLPDEVVHRCTLLSDYFQEQGLRLEHARALALLGAAHARLGGYQAAAAALATSEQLFAATASATWAALVQLSRAELALAVGDYAQAATLTQRAGAVCATAGLRGRVAQAIWLHGEALRRAGDVAAASALLREASELAEQLVVSPLQQRCITSLGLLAYDVGDEDAARAYFERAVALIEDGRAPLPAEEYRVAYFADSLTPYRQLVRLAIARADVAAAFGWIERARGRALLDSVDREQAPSRPHADPALAARRQQLRRRLQFRYDRLNRPDTADERGPQAVARLEQEVEALERELAELDRQLLADGGGGAQPLTLAELQAQLAPDTQLLSYWIDDGAISALLIDADGAQLFGSFAQAEVVEAALQRLQFQLAKFRYGHDYAQRHAAQLAASTERQLRLLYELLLAPLGSALHATRLIVVPHGLLHYVPFAALHDGAAHVLRRYTISLLPSASALTTCRTRPERPIDRPLLLGVPDAAAPAVAREIAALAQHFPQARVLQAAAASEPALRASLADVDALHLACHAVFRPTNPLFSALRLADGWLTVRDASTLPLNNCQLVALSACETGVSHVAPGDELLGLARGFLAAGARALLLSHWPADDAATALLMERFYAALDDAAGYAAALRAAQLEVLERYPHPFHWATFFALAA
jgi:CHAT domain-containing protein/tetratricopeptide (TPR) repeat protein